MSDISVDTSGNIYVSDLLQGVFKFQYAAGIIQPKSTFNKVGTFKIDAVNNAHVYVLTVTTIYEIEWLLEAKIIRTYELPDFSRESNDFQVNERTMVVRTNNKYYFYRIGDTNYEHIIAEVLNNNSRMAVQGTSGQILLINL